MLLLSPGLRRRRKDSVFAGQPRGGKKEEKTHPIFFDEEERKEEGEGISYSESGEGKERVPELT